MNNGAFGENFPYSNFHDLNMDWIIKIAKDFLDQYTNIQETIQTGLDDLDAKATELEGLLQDWYDTHSSDIAQQLANAITELNTVITQRYNQLVANIDQKAAETIASIPDDYTALSNAVHALNNSVSENADLFSNTVFKNSYWEQGTLTPNAGEESESLIRVRTEYITCPGGSFVNIFPGVNRKIYVYHYNEAKEYIREEGWIDTALSYHAINTEYIRVVCAFLDDSTNITPSIANCDVFVVSELGTTTKNTMELANVINSNTPKDITWINRGLYATGLYTDERADRLTMQSPVFVPAFSNMIINVDSTEQCYYYLYDMGMNMYQKSSEWHDGTVNIYVVQDSYLNMVLKKLSGNISVNTKRTTFVITSAIHNLIIDNEVPDGVVFVQGGLTADGHTTTESLERIRTDHAIPVAESSNIELFANSQAYYWYLLDDANNIIMSSEEWKTENSIITVPINSLFNVCIRKTDYSAINPSERTVKIKMSSYKFNSHSYTGEAITIGTHQFSVKDFITLSEQPSWVQGCFEQNDKLFILNDNYCYVFDINTGTKLNTISLSGSPSNHSNTANKSNVYYNGNTDIPLIYFNEYYGNGSIFVNNIVEENGTYTATKVQTIITSGLSTDKVGAGYLDFAIDTLNNKLYLIRYKLADTFQAEEGNYTIITQFELPSMAEENVTLTDADIQNIFVIKDLIFARQQTALVNNKIYMTAGAGANSHLYVIDMNKQQIITDVPLSTAIENKEPESWTIYKNKMLIVCAETQKIKEISFDC